MRTSSRSNYQDHQVVRGEKYYPIIHWLLFILSFLYVANIPHVLLSHRVGVLPREIYLGSICLMGLLLLFVFHKNKMTATTYQYVLWYSAFIFVCLVSAILTSSNEMAFENFIAYSWMAGLSCSYLLLARNSEALHYACLGVLMAVVTMCCVNFIEFLFPEINVFPADARGSSSAQIAPGRTGGLHLDPNTNGYAIVLGLFICMRTIPNSLRLVSYVVVGLAVMTTASRSALLLWGLALPLFMFCGLLGKRKISSYIVPISILTTSVFLLNTGAIPDLIVRANLDMFVTEGMMERFSGNFFEQGDDSSIARAQVALSALDVFYNNPIFGAGLGSTQPQEDIIGTHNIFVKIAAETGFLGLFTFVFLTYIAIRSGSLLTVSFVFLYWFVGLFSHTVMQTGGVYAILLAIAFLNIPMRKKRRRRIR